jgi:DNA-binding transcriptional MerR regulator
MFKIGEFSKLSNISVRSLHHYERIGLLLPGKVDDATGYRFYSADQLQKASQIRMLREIGFSLPSIGVVLQENNQQNIISSFKAKQQELEEELLALSMKKERLRLIIEDIDSGPDLSRFHVAEKDIPAHNVLQITRSLPAHNDVKSLWAELFDIVRDHDIKISQPLFLRARFPDEKNREADALRFSDVKYKETGNQIVLQIGVDEKPANCRPLTFFTAPAEHVASVTFNDGYQNDTLVRQALAIWFEANSREISGPMFSIPHITDLNDPDPDHWINESGFVIE